MFSQRMISSVTVLAVLAGPCMAISPMVLANTIFRRQGGSCPNPTGGSSPNTDYYNGNPGGCPFKNKMDDSGSCKGSLKIDPEDKHCTGYCEVKNAWFYGQEVTINEFPSCRANEKCTYTTTDTLTVTQTFAFNVGASLGKRSDDGIVEAGLGKRDDPVSVLKAGFDIGATYSYSTAKAVAKGLALDRPTDKMSSCGYWTFVPVFWTSCGTMTTSGVDINWYGGTLPTCSSDVVDTGNYCNTSPFLDKNGNQVGATVLVLIDCITNKLLPKEKQDMIYQYPGVAVSPFP